MRIKSEELVNIVDDWAPISASRYLFEVLRFGAVSIISIVLGASAMPGHASAEVIVLRNSDPMRSTHALNGDCLETGDRVRPSAGVHILLLAKTGILSVAHPESLVITDEQVGLDCRIGDAIKEARSTWSGKVVRGGSLDLPSTIWEIDVSVGAKHCLLANAPTVLWRPDASSGRNISIEESNSVASWLGFWPAGEHFLRWPGADSPEGTYEITGGNHDGRNNLHISRITAGSPIDIVDELVKNECHYQIFRLNNFEAEELIESLKVAESK